MKELNRAMTAIRRENSKLIQQVIDTQKNCQDILKAVLHEQQMQRQLMQQHLHLRHQPPTRGKISHLKVTLLPVVLCGVSRTLSWHYLKL